VEPFDLAVGLGSARSGLFDRGAGRLAGTMPQAGPVTGTVVREDSLWGDPDRGVPGGGASPEPGCGGGLLVAQDLGVHDAGPVIDGGVEVAVAGVAVPGMFSFIASPSAAPAAPLRDPSKFLDVNVDQFPGEIPLIPLRCRGVGGPVPPIETTQTRPGEDLLNGRSGQPDLEPDMVRTPTPFPAQVDHPTSQRPRCPVG